MAVYEYLCPGCGPIRSEVASDTMQCRCGMPAKRHWSIQMQPQSARHRGRYDPQVGAYVENERQFRSLLARGQETQAEKLGMDVKLETLDARDHEGLAELSGQSPDARMADLEPTKAAS
jgi:hypothetical protein